MVLPVVSIASDTAALHNTKPTLAAGMIGKVTYLLGQAEAITPEGKVVALKLHMEIPAASRIHVKERSRLNLLMADGGIEKFGADTVFAFEQYDYDPNNPQATLIRKTLLQGEVTSTTGEGGETAKERYRLNSPLAAIAVLGTEYTVRANPRETWVTVHTGAISIAKFGDGCTPSGLGACPGSTLLSEAQQGLALVVNAEQPRPILVPVSALPVTKTEAAPAEQSAAQTAETDTSTAVDKPADTAAEKKPEKTADTATNTPTTKVAEKAIEKKVETSVVTKTNEKVSEKVPETAVTATVTQASEKVLGKLPETTATVTKTVEKMLETSPEVATVKIAEAVIPKVSSEMLAAIPVTSGQVTLAPTPSVPATAPPTLLAEQGASAAPLTTTPSYVTPLIAASKREANPRTVLVNPAVTESLPTSATATPVQNRTPVKAPPAPSKSPKTAAVAAVAATPPPPSTPTGKPVEVESPQTAPIAAATALPSTPTEKPTVPPEPAKTSAATATTTPPASSTPSEIPDKILPLAAETPKSSTATSTPVPVGITNPQPVTPASTVSTLIEWGKYNPATPVSGSALVLSEQVAKIAQHVIPQPVPDTAAQNIQSAVTASPSTVTPPPPTGQEFPVKTATPPPTGQESPVKTATPPPTGQEFPVKTATSPTTGQEPPLKTTVSIQPRVSPSETAPIATPATNVGSRESTLLTPAIPAAAPPVTPLTTPSVTTPMITPTAPNPTLTTLPLTVESTAPALPPATALPSTVASPAPVLAAETPLAVLTTTSLTSPVVVSLPATTIATPPVLPLETPTLLPTPTPSSSPAVVTPDAEVP